MSSEHRWTPERIHALRERLGISQERFGARIGATAATVSRWESGQRSPDEGHRIRMLALEWETIEPSAEDQPPMPVDVAVARLDRLLAGEYHRGSPLVRRTMDAVEHADRSGLSPLALHLAGNAALEAAYGMTAATWIRQREEMGIERERLQAVISELIGAGLWPW